MFQVVDFICVACKEALTKPIIVMYVWELQVYLNLF